MHGAEHLMAGEGGFDGNFGGFLIADFADHDDVGVLPQNGAQGVGERQADLLLGGYLVDPWNLKFDGIFHRDDVVFGTVELVQRGIQRRGFP